MSAAARMSRAAASASPRRSTVVISGSSTPASARASASRSSTSADMRSAWARIWASASRYSSAERGRDSAISAVVRTSETGVRSSCDASAVKPNHVGHRRLQPRQHLVERHRQPADLVFGARHVEPAIQTAQRNRLHLAGDAIDRRQRPAADPVAAGGGDQADPRQQEREHPAEPAPRGVRRSHGNGGNDEVRLTMDRKRLGGHSIRSPLRSPVAKYQAGRGRLGGSYIRPPGDRRAIEHTARSLRHFEQRFPAVSCPYSCNSSSSSPGFRSRCMASMNCRTPRSAR